MNIVARLEELSFDPAQELANLLDATSNDGAVVSFVGVTRRGEDHLVTSLTLDHHPRLTLRSLEQIAADAAARFGVTRVHVVHRCGVMRPGEPIVFAGASSPHRRAAFLAADYLMDRLKTEAVFWKREDRIDGSVWIEPTEADYADRGRWE